MSEEPWMSGARRRSAQRLRRGRKVGGGATRGYVPKDLYHRHLNSPPASYYSDQEMHSADGLAQTVSGRGAGSDAGSKVADDRRRSTPRNGLRFGYLSALWTIQSRPSYSHARGMSGGETTSERRRSVSSDSRTRVCSMPGISSSCCVACFGTKR